jgi:hypothetical protein
MEESIGNATGANVAVAVEDGKAIAMLECPSWSGGRAVAIGGKYRLGDTVGK